MQERLGLLLPVQPEHQLRPVTFPTVLPDQVFEALGEAHLAVVGKLPSPSAPARDGMIGNGVMLSMMVVLPRPLLPTIAMSLASPASCSKSSSMTSRPSPSRMPRNPLSVSEMGFMGERPFLCRGFADYAAQILRRRFCS